MTENKTQSTDVAYTSWKTKNDHMVKFFKYMTVVVFLVITCSVGSYYFHSDKAKAAPRFKVVTLEDGFTVVYNVDETNQYVEAMSSWARSNGFDGIAVGRIQPSHTTDEMLFTTYAGKNPTSMDLVITSLIDSGVNNVVSFMSNRTDFWLPYPFTKQIDGEINIELSEGIVVAGFSLTKKKIRITSNNFNGTISNDMLDGDFGR